MDDSLTQKHLESPFEKIKRVDEQGEYWLARDLQGQLGYKTWREFNDSIERAKLSCENNGNTSADHFVAVHKMIHTGKGATRKVNDFRLTRYACYLVAMNGNPRITAISNAQSYFAAQTHFAETIQKVLPQHKLTDMLADRAKINTDRVPDHYFGVLSVLFLHLYNLERWVKDLDAKASLEISVGKHWRKYAIEVLHIPNSETMQYRHILANGNEVLAWAYSHKWLTHFEKWLWNVYFPNNFSGYVEYRNTKLALPAPGVQKQIKNKERG